MIQFVFLGLLCSAAVISGAPAGHSDRLILSELPNAAVEARRLVRRADWASVGTISTYKTNAGLPMVSVLSTSGSMKGDIYFVLLKEDLATADIAANKKVTFMFSDAQDGGCKQRNVDPMGHDCARTIITGEVETLEPGTSEYKEGFDAFSGRHSFISHMPGGLQLCKLRISNVVVFSGYTGYRDVTPDEYKLGEVQVGVE